MTPWRGKRDHRGAEQPGWFHRVTAPANGHRKLGRLDGDFRNVSGLAKSAQDCIGEPGIGLEIAIKHAVKKRERNEGVKKGQGKAKSQAEAENGAFAGIPGLPLGLEGGLCFLSLPFLLAAFHNEFSKCPLWSQTLAVSRKLAQCFFS